MKNHREQSSIKSGEGGRNQVLNAFVKIEKQWNFSGTVVDGVQRRPFSSHLGHSVIWHLSWIFWSKYRSAEEKNQL